MRTHTAIQASRTIAGPVLLVFVLAVTGISARAPRDLYPIVVGPRADDSMPPKGQFGFIDAAGRVVISQRFPAGCTQIGGLPHFHEGLAPVATVLGGVSSYIDQTGRFAIPAQFVYAGDFHDGIASVRLSNEDSRTFRYAWIDHTGKILFHREYPRLRATEPFPHDYATAPLTNFSEGMLRLEQDGRWGFVNRSFQWVIRPQYTMADDFHDGLALVWIDERTEVVIDKTGKQLFSAGNRTVEDFVGGLARFTLPDHCWGLVDRAGDEVITPCRYRFATPLGQGYAAVSDGQGDALFDVQGRQLTPFKFAANGYPGSFDGKLLPAAEPKPNSDFGYIDASGDWVIPRQFREAYPFVGALALVTLKSGDFAYIDHRGKVVWSGSYTPNCPPF